MFPLTLTKYVRLALDGIKFKKYLASRGVTNLQGKMNEVIHTVWKTLYPTSFIVYIPMSFFLSFALSFTMFFLTSFPNIPIKSHVKAILS